MDYELETAKEALRFAIMESGSGYADERKISPQLRETMLECIDVITTKLNHKKSLVAHALGFFHHLALINTRVAAADLLESKGANAMFNQDGVGHAMFHLIAQRKFDDALIAFSANGLSPNMTYIGRDGDIPDRATLLSAALSAPIGKKGVGEKAFELCATLLECGLDPNIADGAGVLPLHKMLSHSSGISLELQRDFLSLLADYDADVYAGSSKNPHDCGDESVLGMAVTQAEGNIDVLLGAASKRPQHEIERKMLGAFMVAVVNNRRESMQALFDHGCDPSQSLFGYTIEDYLRSSSRETIELARSLVAQAQIRNQMNEAGGASSAKPSKLVSPI